MNLLLKHLRWLDGAADRSGDLRIRRGRIAEIGRGLAGRRRECQLDLSGFQAFPGLINCHDHLALNLLPHLGNPPYPSLYHFGEDVYSPDRSPIREHLQVPVRDRLWWGAYKNLASGVSTVVHHDPYTRRVFYWRFPVKVPRRYSWSHSLGYSEDLAKAFAQNPGVPFIVHAAEGVDEGSHGELDRLDELGALGPETVLVHAVALTDAQMKRLSETGASVVWCPASNLRLYGRTARIDELKGEVKIGLGTDSTVSGSPTLFDEMRTAAATGLATADEILAMVTTGAARIFGLGDRGRIGEGLAADLLLLPDRGGAMAEALIAADCADVAMVLVGGRVRSSLPAWSEALGLGPANACIAGRRRWIYGDLGGLRRRIEKAAFPWRPCEGPLWHLLQPLAADP